MVAPQSTQSVCEGAGSSLLTNASVNSTSSWFSKLWLCIYFSKLNKWSYYGYIQYSFFQTNDSTELTPSQGTVKMIPLLQLP